MKKNFYLLLALLILPSLLSCQRSAEIFNPQSTDNDQFVALNNKIMVMNFEFNQNNPKTRGFFSRLWHRVCCIAAADAGGAAGAYDATQGQEFDAKRGLEILGSAVRSSWEEAWNPTELRTSNKIEILQHSSNDLFKNVLLDGKDRKIIIINKYNLIGKMHNEALRNYTEIISDKYDSINKNIALNILADEIIKTYTLYNPQTSDSQVDEFKNKFLESNYSYFERTSNVKEMFNKYAESQALTYYNKDISEKEANIMTQYIETASQYTSTDIITEYSNKFTEIVNDSEISISQKNRINLYVSVATHSMILWSELN